MGECEDDGVDGLRPGQVKAGVLEKQNLDKMAVAVVVFWGHRDTELLRCHLDVV